MIHYYIYIYIIIIIWNHVKGLNLSLHCWWSREFHCFSNGRAKALKNANSSNSDSSRKWRKVANAAVSSLQGHTGTEFISILRMWDIKAKRTRAQHMALASASSQWVERSSWGIPLRAPEQPAAAMDVADKVGCISIWCHVNPRHVMPRIQRFDIVLADLVDACCGETWEINSKMPRESVWSECTTVSTWNCTRKTSENWPGMTRSVHVSSILLEIWHASLPCYSKLPLQSVCKATLVQLKSSLAYDTPQPCS